MRFLPSFARLTLAAAAVLAPSLVSAPSAEGALLPGPRHRSPTCQASALSRAERARFRRLANPERLVLRDVAASLERGATPALDDDVVGDPERRARHAARHRLAGGAAPPDRPARRAAPRRDSAPRLLPTLASRSAVPLTSGRSWSAAAVRAGFGARGRGSASQMLSETEVSDASRARRLEIGSRLRQQGYGRRRLRVAARAVLARHDGDGVPEEAVPRRAERAHGLQRGHPGARGTRGAVDARRRWWTATWRSCCRRSWTTRPRRPGPTRCGRAA